MKKEFLEEYRKKISELNGDEKKKREIYLKMMASGEILGPQTGYSWIDKPWLKYYIGEYITPTEKTVYQELYDNNINYPNEIALEFFGSKITFKELFKNIDLAAKSFQSLGIKEGDFVTIVAAGIPETVYSFYALSKIGAISNMMGYYFDEQGMIERIKDCKSKILIVMDSFYPNIKSAIEQSSIEKVIIVPTLNSSLLRFFTKKIKLQKNNEMSWNKFIKLGKKIKIVKSANYKKDMPLVMVYSSGTTGASKAIMLSHDSFQNSVYSYKTSGVEMGRGFRFYQIIPPWYSTGLSTSIHLPLANGSTVFMDPRFERKIFINNIIKNKPNYAVAPTSMYEGFLEENIPSTVDLSYFKYPFEGGEPLKKEVSDKIEKVFSKHGSSAKLLVGYGQCECGATITSETPYTLHSDGNVGIPLPGINIMVVDEKKTPLLYRERGEILVDTPCGMLEYYRNEAANAEYFFVDSSGTKWYSTGDIGSIDENGNLYVYGRASDCSTVNSKKVYNFDIENAIMNCSSVKLCDVMENNGVLSVHIVLTEEAKKNLVDEEWKFFIIKEIQQLIYDSIQDEDLIPYSFKFRDAFPYAKSGKRDILSLRQETEGFILVEKYVSKQKKIKK